MIDLSKIKSFDLELANQKHQHKINEDKIKQLYSEISTKDEQIVLVKVELQSVLDKFKVKSEEVSSLKTLNFFKSFFHLNNYFKVGQI